MIDLDTELGILLFVGLFHPSERTLYVGTPTSLERQHDAIQIGSK
jgi:hypothetical protein